MKSTSWDIIGLQKAYGRKPRGSLVGYRGLCADISGASTANGTPVIGYPCRNQWNDRWNKVSTGADRDLFKTFSNDKCLNVSGGTAPGPVISWSCGDYANEDFELVGVEWRAMGNMCVQASNGKLELRTCNGSNHQKWNFKHKVNGKTHTYHIKRKGVNRCVSAQTASGALGEQLVLVPCTYSGDTKQKFTTPGSGRLTYGGNTSLCANVSGGKPTPGSRVILWNGCDSTPPYNSQFLVSGKVRVLGHCMEQSGVLGAQASAETCSSAHNDTQTWEWYF